MITDQLRAALDADTCDVHPTPDALDTTLSLAARRRRRHVAVAAGGCAALVAAAATAVSLPGGPIDPGPAGTGSLSQATFSGAPLSARVSPALAPLGAHLVVWGGLEEDGDPAQASPAVPQPPGADAPVRHDGAVYDPASDRWSPLPAAPLAPAYDAAAVAISERVVLIAGGRSQQEPVRQAALLTADGSSQRWSTLPAPPNCPTEAAMLATGQVLTTGACEAGGPDASLFDPGTRTWSLLPSTGLGPVVEVEAWAGTAAVFDQSGQGRTLAGQRWRPVPAVPASGTGGAWTTGTVGDRLLAAVEGVAGSAEVLELVGDAWVTRATGGAPPTELSVGSATIGDTFVWGTAAGVCSWAADTDVACVEGGPVRRELTGLVRVGEAALSWGGRVTVAGRSTATPTANGVELELDRP